MHFLVDSISSTENDLSCEDQTTNSEGMEQNDQIYEKAESFETIQGNWIYLVDRFEKHVDSEGKVSYRQRHTKSNSEHNASPSVADQDILEFRVSQIRPEHDFEE